MTSSEAIAFGCPICGKHCTAQLRPVAQVTHEDPACDIFDALTGREFLAIARMHYTAQTEVTVPQQ